MTRKTLIVGIGRVTRVGDIEMMRGTMKIEEVAQVEAEETHIIMKRELTGKSLERGEKKEKKKEMRRIRGREMRIVIAERGGMEERSGTIEREMLMVIGM